MKGRIYIYDTDKDCMSNPDVSELPELLAKLKMHADPEDDERAELQKEKLDLLAFIRESPTDELRKFIEPKLLVKIAETSKAMIKAIIDPTLPREYRVNKKWWNSVEGMGLEEEVKKKFIFEQLNKRASLERIESLTMQGCLRSHFREEAQNLATVLSKCPHLTHLDLSNNRLEWMEMYQTENEWNQVKWRCSSLTHLDLHDCDLEKQGFL
jgi:hypothetical protein